MKFLIASILLIFSLNLFAANEIKIEDAKVRLTPPNAPATAIFLKMTNLSEKDLKLLSVTGDFAGVFELHTMAMEGGKMVMRKMDSIEVKSHQSTELMSGGLHIMVFKLKKPLIEGEKHKVNLIFSDKSIVPVIAKVEKIY